MKWNTDLSTRSRSTSRLGQGQLGAVGGVTAFRNASTPTWKSW